MRYDPAALPERCADRYDWQFRRSIGSLPAPLAKLPRVMFFGGGVAIKLGDETIGAIGGAGAPGGKLDEACVRAGVEKIKEEPRAEAMRFD
jgi:uncharacterized protein GlcG (DUF336 family)